MACHHLLWILLGVITEPFWGFTVLGAVISVCAIFYWDTSGSPVIKCLCLFVVFFSLRLKMEKLRNSTQWSLGPSHRDNQLWSNEVFTCWSRLLSWWWLTLSCTDRAGSHDEPWDFFFLENSFVSRFVFQRVWIMITWSIMAQTLKILTDAYKSRIVRGQSTLKDVIER